MDSRSYIVAWVGIAVCLVSCIMFSLSAICIKHQVMFATLHCSPQG
jgi:hypothetical protein